MTNTPNLDPVKSYFGKRIEKFGASPRGVDWNSDASQNVRFDQLLKVVEGSGRFSILDYGCSYGALSDYLVEKGFDADYYGYDIVESAIELARRQHAGKPRRNFTANAAELTACDYVVASGVFNVRGAVDFESWTEYVIETLCQFNNLGRRGFSSNFVTKYSDADKMRPHLYYADPLFLFDFCKRTFSKNVALLHDYRIYDFTILVRKD